ncbi:MAG: response regulator, partial [Actinomycetota bacterium]
MTERRPVILAIDDEPEVLRAVQRDLRARYASDYQILGATGGQEAIDVIEDLKLRDTPLALILADQRMPTVTGVDVLRASLESFPNTKKALLTAYADTEAAISAINDVGLDHYIMKPWDPPDQKLYPILDDLLSDWQAGYRPTF